ncbi:MAG: hypothetical protein ACYDBQ_11450 [Thermoplasmatota archaeon]
MILLGLLLAVGAAAGQLPVVPPAPLAPALNPALSLLLPAVENQTGQDLHREDIRLDLALGITNVDYQIVGILFGGGKVAADADIHMHIEFRAVSAARLDEALRAASGEANVTLNGTFGFPSHRAALTAEEIRLVGAGALLQAFQAFEVGAARRYVEATLPGVSVGTVEAQWSHTLPASALLQPDLPTPVDLSPANAARWAAGSPALNQRDPPIVLDLAAPLHYLSRVSLTGMLHASPSPDADLAARLRKDAGEGPGGASAFSLFGYSQILKFQVPPGWLLNVTLDIPKGFTIEGATPDLAVSSEHRSLAFGLDGSSTRQLSDRPALATLSSRFLVTSTGFVAVVLAGGAVSLAVEAVVMALWRP